MPAFDCDVVVLGAGPSGASAAHWLARAGSDVVLVDKATFPRDKTCGDGLTATALRELDAIGLDVRSVSQPIVRTEMFSPYGRRVELPMQAGLAPGAVMSTVMRRIDLDPMVLDAAVSAGAKPEFGAAVNNVGLHDDHVTVTVDGTAAPLRARWIVGADGVYSKVRTAAFGTPASRIPGMHAIRQYVAAPESDLLTVSFPAELLPGYGWIFPLPGGGVNIGIGVQRDPAECGVVCVEALSAKKGRFALGALGDLYREFLRRPEVTARLGDVDPDALDERIWAWPIPSEPDCTSLAAGRALLVGDAARLADPMTGEGIGQSLMSGRLSAEAILAGGPPAQVVDRYRVRIDREIGRDLRFARFLLKATKRRRGTDWAIAMCNWHDWCRRNFARWMYEDYPRAYILTPDRWGKYSMSGTGAYGASGSPASAPASLR